jgi:2-pyrone-4,6-dicarboxylate lactonase
MFLARDGVEQPGFQELLDFLRHGDGRCWVKLTGTYRMSTAPGFADAAPLAHALIDAAPERLIWGSDYPHLSFADKVGTIELFNLLGQWAAEDSTRKQILVANPQKLFGF